MNTQDRRSVLIVEDQDEIRDILIEVISKFGIDVDGARNGKEGLELITKKPYSVFILDLRMPVMNGLQLLVEIRRIGINTPCIILTGEKDSELVLEAMRLGVIDYLQKPNFFGKIEETVKRGIEIGVRQAKIMHEIETKDPELAKLVKKEEKMIWLMKIFNNTENAETKSL